MAGSLSISKAWDEAKARIAADGQLFVTVALALIALPQAIVGTMAPPAQLSGEEASGLASVLGLIAGLLGIAAQIALIRLALAPASVGEAIGHGFRRLGWTFVALFLFAIGLGVLLVPLLLLLVGPNELEMIGNGLQPSGSAAGTLLLLMIAVLLIAPRFQMIVPVATAERVGPVAMLKRSWQITGGHYFRLLGFLVAVIIVAIVLLGAAGLVAGLLSRLLFGDVEPMSLGALVVALLSALAQTIFTVGVSVTMARIYAQLAGEDPVLEPSVPSSGT